MSRPFLSFLICLVFFAGGCGYRYLGSGANISSVYIAPVKNSIDVSVDYSSVSDLNKFFPDMDSNIRARLSKRFLSYSKIKTTNAEASDLKLYIELLAYRKQAVRFSKSGQIEAYRISLKARCVGKGGNGEVVLPERLITGVADYILTGENANSEDDAVLEAVEDLVKRIVEYVVEQW